MSFSRPMSPRCGLSVTTSRPVPMVAIRAASGPGRFRSTMPTRRAPGYAASSDERSVTAFGVERPGKRHPVEKQRGRARIQPTIWHIRRDSNESDTRELLSIIRPVLQAASWVLVSCFGYRLS